MKNLESVKKNYQFRMVYNKGKSVANKNLVMFVAKNKEPINRLGLSVSKKVGKSVKRNRVRRLLKESFKLLSSDICLGFDIVVIARNPSVDLDFKDMYLNVVHLLKKHNLLMVDKSKFNNSRD